MTKMEDKQNVRQPKWKTTRIEDNQIRRRPNWKILNDKLAEILDRHAPVKMYQTKTN